MSPDPRDGALHYHDNRQCCFERQLANLISLADNSLEWSRWSSLIPASIRATLLPRFARESHCFFLNIRLCDLMFKCDKQTQTTVRLCGPVSVAARNPLGASIIMSDNQDLAHHIQCYLSQTGARLLEEAEKNKACVQRKELHFNAFKMTGLLVSSWMDWWVSGRTDTSRHQWSFASV